MTAGEFWQQQEFAYLVTYSFNRGPKLAEAIQQAKQALQTARYMQQPVLRQKLEELEQLSGKLTNALSGLHPTAVPLARIANKSASAQQLASIFMRSGQQEAYASCRPIYRDALAFYNERGDLLRVLNICFECHFMTTDNGEYVEADWATYQALRGFLESCGHPIAVEEV